MFETPDGTIDISGYSIEERKKFFYKYPDAEEVKQGASFANDPSETFSSFLPEEKEELLSCFEEPGVLITGLMTVAPFTTDEKKIRSSFKTLRDLKENLNSFLGDKKMCELSMGMSNDYKIAIEEGSTMIRLGTLLFGQRGSYN